MTGEALALPKDQALAMAPAEFKAALKKLGYTQAEFADYIGSNLRTINDWGSETPKNTAKIKGELRLGPPTHIVRLLRHMQMATGDKGALPPKLQDAIAVPASSEILSYFHLIDDPTPAFMLDRYDGMLATLTDEIRNRAGSDEAAPEHLRWMIQQMRGGMEPLQASRWLGWVHKGVCDLGLTTSMAEREFTRPHFKPMREAWTAIRDQRRGETPAA